MKSIILVILTLLFPVKLFSQSWSASQELDGLGSGGGMFVDPNGGLYFNQTGRSNNAVAPERPLRQSLKLDDTISNPVAYPFFPTNSGISQKGSPVNVIQDLNGNRIIIWTVGGTVGGIPVMTYQRADGSFGPNSVSLGGEAAVSFRNGLVIALFQSPNGLVEVKEWTVGSDGTLTARPNIPPIVPLDAEFGGCGAAIGIDADNSVVAIFNSDLKVRSANRSSTGVWTLNPTVIDSVTKNVETLGCVYAKASPGGRIVAAWWKTQVGDGSNFDRGGSIRALVREPGAEPGNAVTMISNNPSSSHSRRDHGISVAVGFDGTVGVLASTDYCINKSLKFSQGILRLAGPAENFVTGADVTGISAMDSGANKIWADASNHVPTFAFAVENKKAVFGSQAVAYPNVGTNLKPSCGPGQQITEPQTVSSTAVYFDGVTDTIFAQEIQSFISEPGKFNEFRQLVDAALDFNGNAAIVRAALFGKTSDVIFRGDWQSDTNLGVNNPQATPTIVPPQPTATISTPVDPTVLFSNNVKDQVAKALTLLITAKKSLPTGRTAKDKANKTAIIAARKELNGIIAILIGLIKTDSANISAAKLNNFTNKNLKDIIAAIKSGTNKNLSKKSQNAGWSKAKNLLSKLVL
jgi:hypothetical protein